MMRFFKLLILSIVSVLLIFPTAYNAEVQYPSPTREFYVADYANILSEETKQLIISTNLRYEQTDEKPQIVIATVPSLDGIDIETYSVELFEEWKIGNSGYDNGVLFLLATEDRKVRIEVGYGMEGQITDGRAGEILDNITNSLSSGDYDGGIQTAFVLIARYVNLEYQYEDSDIFVNYDEVYSNVGSLEESEPSSPFAPILLIILIILLIWIDKRFLGGFLLGMFLRSLFHGGRRGGGGGCGGGGFGGCGGGFGGGSFGGGGSSGGGGGSRGF